MAMSSPIALATTSMRMMSVKLTTQNFVVRDERLIMKKLLVIRSTNPTLTFKSKMENASSLAAHLEDLDRRISLVKTFGSTMLELLGTQNIVAKKDLHRPLRLRTTASAILVNNLLHIGVSETANA